ncbi:hypothetical protein C491_10799 [Natronococcus amylolyticus DSM 10524]|uniref:Uncharacterized protein n=1 Tax=Natronococcus amylolyticus DSM 10524 TaxID=1227497 RepID=L9X9E9_9EURY|nr:hypothetical protein [Natronococcus amylolyticus]ELY57268.1 hypothetical protein C491_10799 [Natronococcus amylolyticus DSM 10524]
MGHASLPGARGQTTQDFVVGIGVFLLAVALVFAAIPSVATPADPVGDAERGQADRIADRLVAEFATHNELDGDRLVDELGADGIGHRSELEGGPADEVGVRLERLDGTTLERTDGSPVLEAEATPYEGQPAASSARIVALEGPFELESGADEAAYRLVVRVWK